MKYPQYTLGLVTGFCLTALYFMVPSIIESFKQPEAPQPVVEPVEKHGTFTVISEYKGCDLVQWQYNMLADYKYFLYCASSQGGTQTPQMP
jgi:hypothetical protein